MIQPAAQISTAELYLLDRSKISGARYLFHDILSINNTSEWKYILYKEVDLKTCEQDQNHQFLPNHFLIISFQVLYLDGICHFYVDRQDLGKLDTYYYYILYISDLHNFPNCVF